MNFRSNPNRCPQPRHPLAAQDGHVVLLKDLAEGLAGQGSFGHAGASAWQVGQFPRFADAGHRGHGLAEEFRQAAAAPDSLHQHRLHAHRQHQRFLKAA